MGLANAFKAALNAGGVTEVLYEGITPGEKDYSAIVARLKKEGAEVLYFGGYHPEGGLIARQLADAGVKAQIIGGEGLSNTEYWAIGNQAAAGTLFTNASDALKNPDSAEAVQVLKDRISRRKRSRSTPMPPFRSSRPASRRSARPTTPLRSRRR
jgi:branched-chain amino acid transport system substrate-binding protein